MGPELIYSSPDSVQPAVLGWAAVVIHLESPGLLLPVHLESPGHWSRTPLRWADSCILLHTLYALICVRPHSVAFTLFLFCVLTANPVCVCEQMNRAASYSVPMLDSLLVLL